MNLSYATEIQYATKINGISSLPIAPVLQVNIIYIVTSENLMRININKIDNFDLKLMIESAQILQEKIRIANNRSFIIRSLTNIGVLVKEQENKLKKINILCNELGIIELPQY